MRHCPPLLGSADADPGGGAGSQSKSGDDHRDKSTVADVSTKSLIVTAPEPVSRNLSTAIARLGQRMIR